MKKHLFQIILFLVGMTMVTSCMKDDPAHNSTIYYGYQQIPNINEYMPERLLHVMDSMHCLYYGDEPPRIEGSYIADSIASIEILRIPGSTWSATPTYFLGTRHFVFNDQHIGTSKLEYTYFKDDYFWDTVSQTWEYKHASVESSTTDNTAEIMKDKLSVFVNAPTAPVYFRNSENNMNVFDKAYIIGHDSYFTVYYYEVRLPVQASAALLKESLPFYANIISGRLETENIVETDSLGNTNTIERTVIKDFKWGVETVKYLNWNSMLEQIINMPISTLPNEGEGMILKNVIDVQQKEYEE